MPSLSIQVKHHWCWYETNYDTRNTNTKPTTTTQFVLMPNKYFFKTFLGKKGWTKVPQIWTCLDGTWFKIRKCLIETHPIQFFTNLIKYIFIAKLTHEKYLDSTGKKTRNFPLKSTKWNENYGMKVQRQIC